MRSIQDKKSDTSIFGVFDKEFKNNDYELLFNTKTGFEVLRGINFSRCLTPSHVLIRA